MNVLYFKQILKDLYKVYNHFYKVYNHFYKSYKKL